MNNTLVKKLSLPLITFLIAWVGGLSTIYSDWTWYESLNKPFFNPPNYLFGIVWPILYVLMAVVSFLHAQNIFKLYPQTFRSSNFLFFTNKFKQIDKPRPTKYRML